MRWWNRKDKGYKPPTPFRELASRAFGLIIMLKPYDPDWDHYVRVAIALGMIRPYHYSEVADPKWLSNCSVHIGKVAAWVGNYPYSYGVHPDLDVRPSYATIRLLKKHVDRVIREAGGLV